ncbi:ornithine cyclodeaminase family protein [Pseudohalocynthiibacter aestuariivivens]|jgi:ornithine cyclodeaminase/alanine dehydrogenase-like protein (mu-crystallin family)|uniref:Ornithine cyclodeaminase family protein n=1 Tax=Pseudohalocynthiibacter aestuariivivens TaxID=1591409 RepID=A0ABV5JHH2_9RHOB|nr:MULTISPECIES: ornithine cyclodeaminase [Pseudohalocynthiibacter]MBS9715379.1 ornithine cyclodeaminase [Pseudohalocynthiibacter aestuariivivens]MCK0102675.1 ornithine cyclodeaminase [Pseudohalocynthiibacter sp. F2068]
MKFEVIEFEADSLLSWDGLCETFLEGHKLPKAEIDDTFLYRGKDTLLSRAAWIDGMGIAVKSATIYPDNPAKGTPMINGAVSLFSDSEGTLDALIDFHLVTKWKTAGDSLLGAKLLARPDSRKILIVGAGTVGRNLRSAYVSAFPDAEFMVWNRTSAGAEAFALEFENTVAVTDLQAAVVDADIVTSATMSTEPLIMGEWLKPGQHIDLIGAYRPDMREVDDTALLRSRVFVDSRDTTLDHIGELKTPLAESVISREHVVADFYDVKTGGFKRTSADEITLFKNGGGAHLDLMTSRYILKAWISR